MDTIDQYLVDKVEALRDAGYVTVNSCSGLPEDHVGKEHAGFYLVFIIEKKDVIMIDKITEAAKVVMFLIDVYPFFVGMFGYHGQTKFKRCRCRKCVTLPSLATDKEHQELVKLVIHVNDMEPVDLKTAITSFVNGIC
jgi:hypothetical protein